MKHWRWYLYLATVLVCAAQQIPAGVWPIMLIAAAWPLRLTTPIDRLTEADLWRLLND